MGRAGLLVVAELPVAAVAVVELPEIPASSPVIDNKDFNTAVRLRLDEGLERLATEVGTCCLTLWTVPIPFEIDDLALPVLIGKTLAVELFDLV